MIQKLASYQFQPLASPKPGFKKLLTRNANIVFSLHICPSYNRGINKQQNCQWKGSDEERGVTVSAMEDSGLHMHPQASCTPGAQARKSAPW